MIERSYDALKVAIAIKDFLKSEDKVDPIEWLANQDNIVLVNGRGDVALFEKGIKNIYSGHYRFESRGRSALVSGKEFLDNLFNSCYNIEVLMGLTPLTHLGARWLSRQLGFKSQGVINHYDKHYEMFILTKKEFNQ